MVFLLHRRGCASAAAVLAAALAPSPAAAAAALPPPAPVAFVSNGDGIKRPGPPSKPAFPASGLKPYAAFRPPAVIKSSKPSPSQLRYYLEEGASSTGSTSPPDPTKTLEDYVKDRGGNLVIKKVLIANNGMAGTKSILSMRQWAYMELGDDRAIEFVAMATPEDIKSNAEFVRLADSFVEVPGGKNLNNYANVTVISRVAKEQGVDAVWPGWGHASENPRLPETLNAMGIKFIGPTSPVMSVLGDKIAANILAQTAGLPSVPWSGSYGGEDDGPLEANLQEDGTIPDDIFEKGTCRTVDQAIAVAKRIGYEDGIMIKASEGGGGKGIRLVYREEDMPDMFLQVQNEVVGSPIFLMKLCKNNRHIEIQIVGDEHGNAVAFSGRDCSTQRRFQKIFEEAPPAVVPPDTFREMERAAQRLTQTIGYVGAGTVEFLYNADENKYYFLELNPRLQVEHPVTEGVSNVNLPATQLQVAMGIPLYDIPEVRRFYGKPDMYGRGKIDFLEEEYPPIDAHVIAARITAENPDEGFKPTAGKIERIKFQSTSNVWGYFCVGPNGAIHEYADSQFGHLFAKGPTREAARKALILALKEIEVRGEIRTTVEYLEQLLETEEFKTNSVTTSWLDGLLKEKTVQVDKPPHLVVTSAAIFRAFQHVKTETEKVVKSFAKGQVSTGSIPAINSFEVEIPYLDVRYPFHVELLGPDVYRMTLDGDSVDVRITETEGAILATFGGEMRRIVGMEEPLGLRLVLDGATVLMPNIIDPSELRTDVTGKVVRYLQENGGDVEAGEPYVEVEAMKMIMTMKAKEGGRITHALSPGTVIAAGDLLASVELKDPSKVKKIVTYDGKLDVPDVPLEIGATDAVVNTLAGYRNDPEAVAQVAFAEAQDDPDATLDVISSTLKEFLRVESLFADRILDDAVRDLSKVNADNLEVAISEVLAHQQLEMRVKLVLAMLRQLETLPDRFGLDRLPEELVATLEGLTALKGKAYGDVLLAADAIIRNSKVPPFEVRVQELRSILLDEGADLEGVAKSAALAAGVDMLTSLFSDVDAAVRAAALEVYVRRVYRAHNIIDIDVRQIGGHLTCSWSFQFKETAPSKSIVRHGLISVVPNLDDIGKDLPKILSDFGTIFDDVKTAGRPVNDLYIASAERLSDVDVDVDIEAVERAFVGRERELNMLGIRSANLLLPVAKKDPSYFTFPHSDGYREDPLRRNMRPTFHHLLEVDRLNENFILDKIFAVGPQVQVYIGTEKTTKPVRGGPPQVVFVRAVSNTPGLTTLAGAERSLMQGLDELERAQANSKVGDQSSSRIFLHSLPELDGTTAEEIALKFKEVMDTLKSRHATRLLKLRVDEIEVKVRIATTDEGGNPMVQPVRLVASSMEGEWLKMTAYVENPDPVTGVTREFCVLGDVEDSVCILDPYETSSLVQTKRGIARRVGSTYAYDFLGLLEVGLIGQWDAHLKSMGRQGASVPTGFFQSQELIEGGPNGELVPGTRMIGSNKVGMVAWLVTMKTPEYPNGRDVVFIANDITVKSGSFAVDEDDMYFKASQYARERGLPRVYIACNAGARIGLYEDLKSMLKIKFYDEDSPAKGFEYLYLTEEDYNALPEGTVNAHKVPEGWALDDIIGTVHGIGVENLQGSGKIAGETSRAYDEVFTLSYVTGRSVGIGAYLVRLGQRIIQMQQGPIILTGYSALNKLLGREVYSSQDQLGGPQIMVPNGVTHLKVENDQEGVASILEWLSFVPKAVGALPACRDSPDPVTRNVEWRPTPTPYDPRLMMAGTKMQAGFFDKDSFKEYLAGWGKSVVVGRGRLGGIPMGAIAVETRQVEQVIPADPANPDSSEAILPQAGQVLYPDSSYKTAQAIRDFDKEGLPIVIFANWRGFSGGSRDMAMEILKYGSMIVDALREYTHPVYIYIPPHGELRGGSWVVLDTTINPEQIEMYADPDSRGGILEPAGIAEVKFRLSDQLKVMHKNDPQLQLLDAELEMTDSVDEEAQAAIKEQIAAREELLKPVYLQAATEFADLHDKTGRMKAKGVIMDAVPWERARAFFYYRAKRRMMEDEYVQRLKDADESLDTDAARKMLNSIFADEVWEDNPSMIQNYTIKAADIEAMVMSVKLAAIQAKMDALKDEENRIKRGL